MTIDSRLSARSALRKVIERLGREAELLQDLGKATLDEAVEAVIRRTRQFAVRQERWFRRDPRVRWIDIDATAPDPLEPVRSAVIAELV